MGNYQIIKKYKLNFLFYFRLKLNYERSGLIKKIISKSGKKQIGRMYNMNIKDWLEENAIKEELQLQLPNSPSGIEDLDFSL